MSTHPPAATGPQILAEVRAIRASLSVLDELTTADDSGIDLTRALIIFADRLHGLQDAIDRLYDERIAPSAVVRAIDTIDRVGQQVAANTARGDEHSKLLAESVEWKQQLYRWMQRITYGLADLEQQSSRVVQLLDPIPAPPEPPELHVIELGGERHKREAG